LVVTGRAVVVRFSVEVTGPVEGIVTGLVVKLQLAAVGTPALQLREILPVKTGCGVSVTV
jgi:hypothetical protein